MDRTTTRVEAAYVAQHAAALASLQALQAIIEDMPAPDGDRRINWCLVEPFGVSNTLAWAVVQVNEDTSKDNTEQARRHRWAEVRAWAVRHLQEANRG